MTSLQVEYMLVIFSSEFTIKNCSYVPAWKGVVDMKSWEDIQVYLEVKAVFSLEDFKGMWKSAFGSCKKGWNSNFSQQLSIAFPSFI